MELMTGDMMDIAIERKCKAIGFAANGYLVASGALCMGSGAAAYIKGMFPGVDIKLGTALGGVKSVVVPDYHLVVVPYMKWQVAAIQTKRHFNDHQREDSFKACWDLTVESIKRVADWQKKLDATVVINCPLIGDGGYGDQEQRVLDMLEQELGKSDVIVCRLD